MALQAPGALCDAPSILWSTSRPVMDVNGVLVLPGRIFSVVRGVGQVANLNLGQVQQHSTHH